MSRFSEPSVGGPRSRRGGPVAMVVLLVTQAAMAQQAPDFETIRGGAFTGDDRQRVADWVDGQLRDLFAAGEDVAQEGSRLFFRRPDGLVPHASEGSASFRQGLAEVITQSFLTVYRAARQGGSPPPPLAVVYPLTALRVIGQPEALDAFMEALNDPTPIARLAAAQGLEVIRDRLPDQSWANVVQAVQQAATVETHNAVLGALYRVLTVEAAGRLNGALAAVTSIVDARAQAYEDAQMFPLAAEGVAVDWLGGIARRSETAQQVRIDAVRRIARLLADAVHGFAYRASSPLQKDWAERLAERAEGQLTVIAGQMAAGQALPDVTEPMLNREEPLAERIEPIMAELAKWIGAPQAEGVLNRAPFNLPRGLEIRWAATQPAVGG